MNRKIKVKRKKEKKQEMNSLAFGWVPEWTLLLVLGFLRAPLYPFNFKQTIFTLTVV